MKLLLWGSLFVSFHCASIGAALTLRDPICKLIELSVSSASDVYYPGDALYEKGIYHYAVSSTEQSKCVVEAGSSRDVGKILVILGLSRTPFAVKGGGHATNVGFSSTTGVHISMYRFSKIEYNPNSQTVKVGTGLIFDDVYAALDKYNVNVLGGRVTGIGVAGFTLGGGYSWKTNQYGLAIDSVVSFELVKPNGQVIQVTQQSDPQLFFGLKGGLNNFGVVTELTLKTYPQTKVYAGSIYYPGAVVDLVSAATVAFQSVPDPKAAIITSYNYVSAAAQIITCVQVFYDAPTPPAGLFDAFLAIPSISSDVATKSFTEMIQTSPGNFTEPTRTMYQYLPNLVYTAEVAALIVNETQSMGEFLTNKGLSIASIDVEIFRPDIYSHNPHKTAFPPVRNIPFQPFIMFYAWNSAEFDADFRRELIASQDRMVKGQIAIGQTDVANYPYYPNYALAGTPLQKLYGANLPALQALKRRIDPTNVMGLAGGWKF